METKTTQENSEACAGLAAATGSTILPCPYCGKTTTDRDEQTGEAAVIATCYTETNSNVVQCNWCGLSGPIFGRLDEAIEAWNEIPRRSSNDELSDGPSKT